LQIPFSLSVQVTALIVSFVFTIVTGPVLIPILRKLKFGQTVREDGPVSHYKKTGTPTMGGIIFLIPITFLTIYYCAAV
jgi:phospho-N-acetylmuramoyl-pentapeptide-transferase